MHFNQKWNFCILGQWPCQKFEANHFYKNNESKDNYQYKFGSAKAYLKRKRLTSGRRAPVKNVFAKVLYQ